MNENVNRDLFITETIINHLQRLYPQEYSDAAIIKKYKKYVELSSLKQAAEDDENVNFSTENEAKLAKLNTYFYGNSDGNRTSAGDGIAARYVKTIQNIKAIIDSNDNAVKDIVTNIYQLIDIGDLDNKDSFNKYINEIVIPGLQSENSSVKQITDFTIANKVINDNIDKTIYDEKIAKKTQEKKEKEDKQKADIERYKEEQNVKDEAIKVENVKKGEEQKQKKLEKEEKKKEELKQAELKEEISKSKDYDSNIDDKFQEIQNLIINSEYKEYYNKIITDYISIKLDKTKDSNKITILEDLQAHIKILKFGGIQKTPEELTAELKAIKENDLREKQNSLDELKKTKTKLETDLETTKTEKSKLKSKLKSKTAISDVDKQKNIKLNSSTISILKQIKNDYTANITEKFLNQIQKLILEYSAILDKTDSIDSTSDESSNHETNMKIYYKKNDLIKFDILKTDITENTNLSALSSKLDRINKYNFEDSEASINKEQITTTANELTKKLDKLKEVLSSIVEKLRDNNINSTTIQELNNKIEEYETKLKNDDATNKETLEQIEAYDRKIEKLEGDIKELDKKITGIENEIEKTKKDDKDSKEKDIIKEIKVLEDIKSSEKKYKIPDEFKILFINELEIYIKLFEKRKEFNIDGKSTEDKKLIYEQFIKLYDKFIVIHNQIISKLASLNKDIKTNIDKSLITVDDNLKQITDIFNLSIYNANTIDDVVYELEKKLLDFSPKDDITKSIKVKIESRINFLTSEIAKIKKTLGKESLIEVDDKEQIKINIKELLQKINLDDEYINSIIENQELLTEEYLNLLKSSLEPQIKAEEEEKQIKDINEKEDNIESSLKTIQEMQKKRVKLLQQLTSMKTDKSSIEAILINIEKYISSSSTKLSSTSNEDLEISNADIKINYDDLLNKINEAEIALYKFTTDADAAGKKSVEELKSLFQTIIDKISKIKEQIKKEEEEGGKAGNKDLKYHIEKLKNIAIASQKTIENSSLNINDVLLIILTESFNQNKDDDTETKKHIKKQIKELEKETSELVQNLENIITDGIKSIENKIKIDKLLEIYKKKEFIKERLQLLEEIKEYISDDNKYNITIIEDLKNKLFALDIKDSRELIKSTSTSSSIPEKKSSLLEKIKNITLPGTITYTGLLAYNLVSSIGISLWEFIKDLPEKPEVSEVSIRSYTSPIPVTVISSLSPFDNEIKRLINEVTSSLHTYIDDKKYENKDENKKNLLSKIEKAIDKCNKETTDLIIKESKNIIVEKENNIKSEEIKKLQKING